ncbi:MAG: hypothetical protein ACK4SX_03305 [Alcanivoracaceae bacterium]
MDTAGNVLLGCIALVVLAVLFLFLMRFSLVIVIAVLSLLIPVAVVLLLVGAVVALFSSD